MIFAPLQRHRVAPALFLVGAALAAAGIHQGREHRALEARGVAAEATVDRVTWQKKAAGQDQAFKIEVRFETAERRTVRATLTVPRSQTGRVAEDGDGRIAVTYLPDAPETVMIPGTPDDSRLMTGAGAAIAAVGALFHWRRRRAAGVTPPDRTR